MATPTLNLDVRPVGDATAVIDIRGEVTAASEQPLSAAYEEATQQHGAQALILNFTDLEYMNSSGIGMLVPLLVRANRQHQKLAAYGLTDHYRQIFELTRLDEAITIFDDEPSALSSTGTV
jgi:anti-sigma B factor antagonist